MGLFDWFTSNPNPDNLTVDELVRRNIPAELIANRITPETFRATMAAQRQAADAQQLGLLNQEYTASSNTVRPGVLEMDPARLAANGIDMPSQVGLSDAIYGKSGAFTPNNSYFARAAAIPSYQGVIQGMQDNYGAMDRQTQEQTYKANNMSLYETTMQKLEEARLGQQKLISDRDYDINKGRLNLSEREFAAKQTNDAAKIKADNEAKKFPGLALTGKDAIQDRQRISDLDMTYSSGKDIIDYVGKSDTSQRLFNPSERKSINNQWQSLATIYIKNKFAGQGSEASDKAIENYREIIGGNADIFSFTATQKAKAKALLEMINTDRQQAYGNYGMQPPVIQPGQSPWAQSRSKGNTLMPSDIKWGK